MEPVAPPSPRGPWLLGAACLVVVVLAWLQAQHYGEPLAPLRLRGLDPTRTYECRETGEKHRGAVLAHHGLSTALRGDFDATVIRLRRT